MEAAAGRPTCSKNTGFKFEDTLKPPKTPNPTTASSNKAVLLPQIFNKPFLDVPNQEDLWSVPFPIKILTTVNHRIIVIQVIESFFL